MSCAEPTKLFLSVKEFCRQKLDKWSCPKAVEVLPELPKTLMAKTDYRLLERNGMKKFVQEETDNDVKTKKICKIISINRLLSLKNHVNCKYSGGTSSRRINAFLSLGVLKNINVVSENI